ncbi:MAG: hypothetical protein AAFR56_03475 [Chloroflexota bacterium]
MTPMISKNVDIGEVGRPIAGRPECELATGVAGECEYVATGCGKTQVTVRRGYIFTLPGNTCS